MAASGLMVGVVPSLEAATRFIRPDDQAVNPAREDSDAAVFAAARKQFLFPTSVTYCNTGTLGASPRPVVEALVNGIQRLEHDLPDWPYSQADGEPLTGYQPLTSYRGEV